MCPRLSPPRLDHEILAFLASCIHGLLRWSFLNIPAEAILHLATTRPRQQNRKRLDAVLRYLRHPATPVELRIVTLCLRLSMLATNISSRKQPTTSLAGAERPVLLQLAQGDVCRRVSLEFQRIVAAAHLDETLRDHMGELLEAASVTACDIIVRFGQYQRYPSRVVLLSKTYNGTGGSHVISAVSRKRVWTQAFRYPSRRRLWHAGARWPR